jgi:ABC-type transport system involved in cytochrome bd biosynthesis fused ATPase/permease subunit
VRRARPVRAFLGALAGIGAADAVLLIVQATLLADLISGLVLTPRSQASYAGPVAGLIAASLGRAALAWFREACAVRTSTAVKAALRADLIKALTTGRVRAADRERAGEAAVLATRGIDALDGYFARYLPQLALAAIVPAVLGVRILTADPLSALIIALTIPLTIPLIPLFMILIGLMTRDHVAERWSTLERLGGHFLEVVAGLPTLVAFGRAKAQQAAIRRAADAHRRATSRTLRVAFLSSLVLELIAMLSVALVAVAIGLRLADGSLSLRTGLLVLICAPEVYLPLRRLPPHLQASSVSRAYAFPAKAARTRSCQTSNSRSKWGEPPRWSARAVSARPRCCTCYSASTPPPVAASPSATHNSPTLTSNSGARDWPGCLSDHC